MSKEVPEAKGFVNEPIDTTKKKRPFARIVGIVLIAIAVLAAWLLLVSFLGYQSGQQLLVEKQEAEYVAAINRQIELAREDMAQEKYQLALVRLEWVLEREPNQQEALALQETIKTMMAAAGNNPTPNAVATAVSTPRPPSAEESEISSETLESPSEELQRIRRLVATKSWPEALSALLAFQMTSPNFERQETDRLLYEIYIDYGLELINGHGVELGLNYLSQAEKLGDLPQEVEDYRIWAALYTQGISYHGVNWDLSAYFFRDLCLSAPFYQNSCDIFYEVVINLADQYAANLDWCPALQSYEEASLQQTTAELNEKISTAREMCLQATATPAEPISDTLPISNTEQLPPIELPTNEP